MSVKVRQYRKGGWEVDVRVRLPDGRVRRERRKAPCSGKSGAVRWGEALERELLKDPAKRRREVPTLEEFAPRFIDGHARANRQKPGGIAHKEQVLRLHLIPRLGARRLDAITNEDVQLLKHHLSAKAVRTVNNVLTVLNTLLKKAVEWDVLERLPCTVRLLKVSPGQFDFYDFDEYEALVTAAGKVGAQAQLVVLLGGDAGLRTGEMRALEWTDVNFVKRQVCVARNDWRGQVSTTKGGRIRYVPLTQRLHAALQRHRHLRGPRVLWRDEGRPFAEYHVEDLLRKVARLANLRQKGPHTLRHTFCSHLAMRSVSVRAIQELAGHKDLTTTQRYMHLSPSAITDAIRQLEQGHPGYTRGDIVETGVR